MFGKLTTYGDPYPFVLSPSKDLPYVNNRKALTWGRESLTLGRASHIIDRFEDSMRELIT